MLCLNELLVRTSDLANFPCTAFFRQNANIALCVVLAKEDVEMGRRLAVSVDVSAPVCCK